MLTLKWSHDKSNKALNSLFMHFTYPKGEKKTRREKTERKEKNNNNSQPNENVNDEKKSKYIILCINQLVRVM